MKRILCLSLSFVLAFSMLIGCGKSNDTEKTLTIDKATASIPFFEESMNDLNATTNMAINSYLVSRAYLEMICNYDIESGSEEELRSLIDKAMNSFTTSEELSANMQNIAEINEMIASDPEVKGTYEEAKALIEKTNRFENPFAIKVYAAEESDALSEARKIVEIYDKAPQLKGIKTLAEHLGTDSKHAYATLKQALATLDSKEYSDLASKEDAAVKTCMGLKTAGTAAGLVITVSTCGATTAIGQVMECGGLVLNGANTICEVTSFGSTIVTGNDENIVAKAANKVEDSLAGASSIVGLYGCCTAKFNPRTMKAEDFYNIVSFAVPEINNIINDGKVLGGLIETNEEAKTVDLTFATAPVGKTPEEATKTLSSLSEAIEIPSSTVAETKAKIETNFDELKETSDEISNSDVVAILENNSQYDPNSSSYVLDDAMDTVINDLMKVAEENSVSIVDYGYGEDVPFSLNEDYDEDVPFSLNEDYDEDVPFSLDEDYDEDDVVVSDTNPFSDSDVTISDSVDYPVAEEPELNVQENDNGVPSASEIVGTYTFVGTNNITGESNFEFSTATFTINGDKIHISDPGLEGDFDLNYDASNGTCYISEDNATMSYRFYKDNGKVKCNIAFIIDGYAVFQGSGTKK